MSERANSYMCAKCYEAFPKKDMRGDVCKNCRRPRHEDGNDAT